MGSRVVDRARCLAVEFELYHTCDGLFLYLFTVLLLYYYYIILTYCNWVIPFLKVKANAWYGFLFIKFTLQG